MTPNQPGGGDGEKRACFRIEIWFANYRGPHLTRKRYADGPEISLSVKSVDGTRIRVGSGQG